MKNIIFVAAVVFSFILMGYGLYNGHRAKNNEKIAQSVSITDGKVSSLVEYVDTSVIQEADSLVGFRLKSGELFEVKDSLCRIGFLEITYERGSQEIVWTGSFGSASFGGVILKDTVINLNNGFDIIVKKDVFKLFFDDNLCFTRFADGSTKISEYVYKNCDDNSCFTRFADGSTKILEYVYKN